MKNRWMKTTGVVVLAVIMLSGINAQPRFGGGNGPDGQRIGPGCQGNCPYGKEFNAHRRGSGPHGMGPGMGHALGLDLTEEQQEQMKALRLEHHQEMKPLKNQMAELKARERTLLSEKEVDMKSVHKVIDDQTALMNKIRKLQTGQKVAAREILTDEQVMKLDQRRKFSKRRWAHRDLG